MPLAVDNGQLDSIRFVICEPEIEWCSPDGRLVHTIIDQQKIMMLDLLQEHASKFCSEAQCPCSSHMLMEITEELSANGLRYGNRGDPKKRLIVECRFQLNENLPFGVIRVEDEGDGIPIEKFNRTPEEVLALYSNDTMEGGFGLIKVKGLSRKVTLIGKRNIIEAEVPLFKSENSEDEKGG